MRILKLAPMLLATSLLAVPACSQADRTAGNDKDAAATARANHVTNDTDSPDEKHPAATPNRDQQATGTAGSIARSDEAGGAGPDAVITMRIQAKYAENDVVKSRTIDVDTENGVVTLKGGVGTRRERDAAEQLARETDGVKRVVNDLKVETR
jgi:osmotically-inducible protein OsmY